MITEEQFRRVEGCFPTQRGNVAISNLDVLNAILYVAEHGCKWRGLPKRFGRWHTVYTRMNRWAKAGVLDRVFAALQEEEIIRIKVEALAIDSTIVKVHPDGTGAEKKRTAVHRTLERGMDHEDSYGCRGCPKGGDLFSLTGPGPRCTCWPSIDAPSSRARDFRRPDHGSGLRRQ